MVVGDIVLLNTGDEVPADGKLLEATTLSIDESTLTGEPSCVKTTDPSHFDPEATFPSDHAMRGTKIMEGHGIMEVFAVGDKTENGKVFKAAQIDNSVKTPLDEQFDRLGRMISIFSYVIAVAIIIGRVTMYFIHQDFDWITFVTFFLAESYDCSDACCRIGSRRSAYGRNTIAGIFYEAYATHQQSCPQTACLRDNGCYHCNMHRQDRHSHSKSDAGLSD